MTFLLCTNKVIFLSGFCPAVRDVWSGSEEEPLHQHTKEPVVGGRTTTAGLCPERCLRLGFARQVFEMMSQEMPLLLPAVLH